MHLHRLPLRRFLRPRRLRTRMRVVSLLLVTPLLVVATVSGVGLALSRSAGDRLNVAQQQRAEMDSLMSHLDDMKLSGAAYLATRAEDELTSLETETLEVSGGLANLRALTPLSAAQASLVDAVQQDWGSTAAIRQQVVAGTDPTGAAAIADMEDFFVARMSAVDEGLGRLIADNAGTVATLRAQQDSVQTAAFVAVAVSLAVGVLAALALSTRMAASVIRPLERLRDAADRLARGDGLARVEGLPDDELGDLGRAFNTMGDRLEERRRAVELREQRLAALVENANDGILVVSAEGQVVFATPTLHAEFGIGGDHAEPLEERVHPEDLEHVIRAWLRVVAEPQTAAQIEARLKDARGTWRHVWAKMSNRLDDDAVQGVVLNITDVSERHAYEQQLTWQALHDPLTGLANRELLRRRLEDEPAGHVVSLLYIDFDDFKGVNDRHGHAAGDDLLKEMAHRLDGAVRPQDLVARIGGDEYAILLDKANARQAVRTARRVRRAIGAPMIFGKHVLHPTASIGTATTGVESTTAETVIGDADLAMYAAKRDRKGSVRSFEASMRADLIDRMQLGEDLRVAVEKRALTVVYQPVIALSSGRVAGVEALARWEHPTRGSIPPSAFIPLAEQLGLVERIDLWVLERACGQGRAWLDAGLPPIRVAVNMSSVDLANPELPARVAAVLASTGLPAELLEVEVTESAAIAETAAGVSAVCGLKNLGIQLSIDDFGTGYSALARLRALPFDRLKVDKTFVDELRDDAHGPTLVDTILEMAQMLGLQVVAEGVETPEQAHYLRDQLCDLAQGYYFSRPVDAAAIEAMLQLDGDGAVTEDQRTAIG